MKPCNSTLKILLELMTTSKFELMQIIPPFLQEIYTIKTQLKYIYVYIMFICSELIEETGRPPGLIFCMWGYFWPGSDKFESWKIFHTFDKFMT